MPSFARRDFIKMGSLSFLPLALPGIARNNWQDNPGVAEEPVIKLFLDGEMFTSTEYLSILTKYNQTNPFGKDRYGEGGAVQALEKKFQELTGKEKAIFMPSGTMANQFAIAVLSGDNTKVFVQETSHVYRDEADAAQSVFQKRLIPLGRGKTYFTAEELEKEVGYHLSEEVFKSGIGVVSIENPVRRTDGKMVPLEEIKKIHAYCRKNNFRLHLDGARLNIASVWSGVSIKEYSNYFDTVYISLYKALGAASGAILCGNKEVIDKMVHLMKIHGGSMYGNWLNAAMALHRMEGLESRLKSAIATAEKLFSVINKNPGINVSSLQDGTNIYLMKVTGKMNGSKMVEQLGSNYNIRMARPDRNGEIRVTVNETLLYREPDWIIEAFTTAIKVASA